MRLFLPFFALLILLFSCTTELAPDPLEAARQKISDARSISFEMKAVWNNTYVADTSVEAVHKGTYLRTDREAFPYDFVYKTESGEYLYLDGKLVDVELEKGRIVTYSKEETREDLAYEGSYTSMMSPMMLIRDTAWARAGADGDVVYYDKVLGDSEEESGHAYTFARLHIDSLTSKIVLREQFYSLNDEPMQHIQRHYSSFAFDEIDTLSYDYPDGFTTIAYADLETQKQNELVKAGDAIPDFDLVDVNENTYSKASVRGKKTVFIFSFIGCGGCELARKHLAKTGFEFHEDYIALYINPMNSAEQIVKYHREKPWPFKLAAADYDFSARFGVYTYPTFISVDESGRVEEVIEGYDEEEFMDFFAGKGVEL